MRSLLLLLSLFLWFGPDRAFSQEADKAALQAAMHLHLDQMSVDGAIIHLDDQTQNFMKLYPAKSHPMVFAIDDHFVLCADLVNENGERRTIDVYILKTDGEYRVTSTRIDDRATLKAIMEQGRTGRVK